MEQGYVVIHRQFLKWEWATNSNMVNLFVHLLLMANHQDNKWQGIDIKRGQLITGLDKLSKITGISAQTLRTCLTRLKSTGEITSISTNKFRIITILKYDYYQSEHKKSTSKLTSKLTINQQTTNKQLTANNNDNNYKNDNNILKEHSSLINPVMNEFKEINPTLNYGNINQRKAVEELLAIYPDTLVNMIKWYKTRMGDRFCPTATTPIAFKNKLGDITAYANKLKNPVKGSITKI